jgi:hypothetical protein
MRLVARFLLLVAGAALAAPTLLFAATTARAPVAPAAMIYRVELASGSTLLARTPPIPHGNRIVFSSYPDGALVSLKRSDVVRVVSAPASTAAPAPVARTVRPGTLIILGPTGERGGGTTAATAGNSVAPGQAPDGRALLNPGRDYRPEWDARQVPGQNLAFPASPGDYREGMTFAYPPGTAVQSGPGQPPTGVPSGEPPKVPQR